LVPNDLIIYYKTQHKYGDFRSLGEHKVHELDNYILIQSLQIGGFVLTRTPPPNIKADTSKIWMQLDNGIILQDATIDKSYLHNLVKPIRDYARSLHSEQGLPIIQAHINQVIFNHKQYLASETKRICYIQHEIRSMQQWIINMYPHAASKILKFHPGLRFTPLIDAIYIESCAIVTKYVVLTSRRIGNDCYADIVIKLPSGQFRFLDVNSRQLYEKGKKIGCDIKQNPIALNTTSGYKLVKYDGKVENIPLKNWVKSYNTGTIIFNHVHGYNKEILNREYAPLHPLTLSEIIAATQDTLNELHSIHSNSQQNSLLGSILYGVGTVLTESTATIVKEFGEAVTNVMDEIADPEHGLIHAIGSAAVDVLHATGDAVSETEDSFGDMLFKNIFGLIALGVLLLLGMILFYRFGRRSCSGTNSNTTDNNTEIEPYASTTFRAPIENETHTDDSREQSRQHTTIQIDDNLYEIPRQVQRNSRREQSLTMLDYDNPRRIMGTRC